MTMSKLNTLQVLLACDRNSGKETIKRPAFESLINIDDDRIFQVVRDTIYVYKGGNAWQTEIRYGRDHGKDGFVALRLHDNKIAIIGGKYVYDTSPSAEAQLYDPETKQMASLPNMPFGMANARGVELADGAILIFGGTTRELAQMDNALILRNGGWTVVPIRRRDRTHGMACVLLLDGRVFIMGGGIELVGRCELFDPTTNTFTDADSIPNGRTNYAAAATLPDGRVLVCGGDNGQIITSFSYLYDPARNAWARTLPLAYPRRFHTLAVLNGGELILAYGGTSEQGRYLPSEKYNIQNDTWRIAFEYELPINPEFVPSSIYHVTLFGKTFEARSLK